MDAIASIKSKGYSTDQVQERKNEEMKMNEEKIERAKQLRADGCTLSHIGRELGVSAVTIKNILDKEKEDNSEAHAAPAPASKADEMPGSVLRCIQSTISDKLRAIEMYESRIAEEKAEVAELQRYVRAYERG